MVQLFQNVLTASFHGSIVILAVLILRLALKNTPRKFLCLLWLLAGLRLLMPFEIQSQLSLQPDRQQINRAVQEEFEALPVFHSDVPLLPSASEEVPPSQAVQTVTPQGSDASAVAPTDTSLPPAPEKTTALDLMAVAAWIWLAIAAMFGVYTLWAYVSLRRKVREAVNIPGGWECDRIETAFILGFLNPQIYIPMGMPQPVRKYILAHERTHLEKGDHWFKMIGFLALALHWFNPLVWTAYILLCKDIELACDERVVQFMDLEERKRYSHALLTCSTPKLHFAACPVAFGEVSVKERIQSVLRYKRPSFWISLLGVVAIGFVAVCLVTSPVEESPAPSALSAPTETEAAATEIAPEETEVASTFAATLDQSDIIQVCTDAINVLCEKESYLIDRVSTNEYPEEDRVYSYNGTIHRYGQDALFLNYEPLDSGEISYMGSQLYFGDLYGFHYGDYWVNAGQRNTEYDINSLLKEFSPEGKIATQPEIISDDTVSFFAQWEKSVGTWTEYYTGTITFTFRNDGSVAKIARRFQEQYDGIEEDDPVIFTTELTILEEDPQQTYKTIADHAAQCISLEQLDKIRSEKDKITEIPSNKTDYDKDFMLGSGQMRWYYFDKAWQFALGAENGTDTGLTLKYCESGDDHQSLVAEEGFWIEELVDGVWTVLEPETPVANAPAENVSVSWSGTDTVQVNWADSYGRLPHGFYRLGRYHTATMADGRSETIHCYAKFRIYDPNKDALLSECQAALDALLTEDVHFYTFDWMIDHEDFDYYLSTEVWKAGQDCLEVTRYPLRSDLSQMKNVRGSLWRQGKHYGVEWAGEPAVTPVSQWDLGVDGYITGSNVDIALMGYEWYDAWVEEVWQDGNKVHIIQTLEYSEMYEASELILTIEDGHVKAIVSAYLPTRTCTQAEKVISEELVVFDDDASQIREVIYAQDVTTPMPFHYEEDVKNTPNAKTSGFKNTTPKPVTTAAEALALADKESTMPQLMEFEGGYCQSMTYYDPEAKMWKVHLFWWQHDTAQTIYLDANGITQRIVSVE